MEVGHRIAALRRHMEEHDVALCLITQPDNQYYLSDFKAVIYSRPIDLLITPDHVVLVVPGLEEVHARAEAAVDELFVYYEHPEMAHAGGSHVDHVDHILGRLPGGARVGVEADVIPLALADHVARLGFATVDVGPEILALRMVKDEAELALMTEAGRLAALGLHASLQALREGITEVELDAVGNAAIMAEVAARHPGATLDLFAMSPAGAVRTVMPHVFSNTRPLEQGDVLIHSRQVALNGYRGESERTCFIGRPTPRQRHAFEVVLEAQLAGLDALRPGVPMREVDAASRSVIQQAGFGEYFIHRTGHAIGLAPHEPPSLRFDEEMPLAEGMVFTVEPAVFIPGLGGFRHSDTAIITRDGRRITTEYPNDLESMTF